MFGSVACWVGLRPSELAAGVLVTFGWLAKIQIHTTIIFNVTYLSNLKT